MALLVFSKLDASPLMSETNRKSSGVREPRGLFPSKIQNQLTALHNPYSQELKTDAKFLELLNTGIFRTFHYPAYHRQMNNLQNRNLSQR
ncbi:hypothetical protein NSTC745_02360 [Nostoc sp. DSM 114161]